jgi:hypothetical protein
MTTDIEGAQITAAQIDRVASAVAMVRQDHGAEEHARAMVELVAACCGVFGPIVARLRRDGAIASRAARDALLLCDRMRRERDDLTKALVDAEAANAAQRKELAECRGRLERRWRR